MEVCYLKKFDKKPELLKDFLGHVLIIITKRQSDEILRIISKLTHQGYKVTLIFSNKYHVKRSTIHLNHTKLHQVKLPGIEYYKCLYNALIHVMKDTKKPSILLVDKEVLLKDVFNLEESNNCFETARFTIKRVRHVSLRGCRSHVNFKILNIIYDKFPTKLSVHDFLPLPKFVLFFAAFGYFRDSYHYRVILNSFKAFIDKQEKFYGNEIVMIFGGNFNYKNYADDEFYIHFESTIAASKYASNIILVKKLNIEQKKAILKLSYAMIYLNSTKSPSDDVKIALSVGTPLIGINEGYIKHVHQQQPQSGFIMKLKVATIVRHMYLLTQPTDYKKASFYAKLNYLKHHAAMSNELENLPEEITKCQ